MLQSLYSRQTINAVRSLEGDECTGAADVTDNTSVPGSLPGHLQVNFLLCCGCSQVGTKERYRDPRTFEHSNRSPPTRLFPRFPPSPAGPESECASHPSSPFPPPNLNDQVPRGSSAPFHCPCHLGVPGNGAAGWQQFLLVHALVFHADHLLTRSQCSSSSSSQKTMLLISSCSLVPLVNGHKFLGECLEELSLYLLAAILQISSIRGLSLPFKQGGLGLRTA